MTSPFPLPILFTAWTWRDGAGIAGTVIKNARLGGFETVAIELSEDTGGDPGSSLDAQDVQYLKGAGLTVVGWGPVDGNTARQLSELGVDGWLPQVETPAQRDALIALLSAGHAKPDALVTTYGGLDTTADVAALVKAWGAMPLTFVECYKADGFPHDDISRMLGQGQVYGFDGAALRALVGTYKGELPADYPGLTTANYGGAYLEEPMTSAQFQAFAQIAPTHGVDPTPTPEPTVQNDSAARKAQIEKIAEDWLAVFGPAPLTRLAVIDRVAKSGPEWENGIRQDVADALDGKVADLRAALAQAVKDKAAMEAKIEAAKNDLA